MSGAVCPRCNGQGGCGRKTGCVGGEVAGYGDDEEPPLKPGVCGWCEGVGLVQGRFCGTCRGTGRAA